MKRRRVEESADGLALMTSSVTSSHSADGLREQSQESADSAGRLCVDNQSQDSVASYSGSRRKQQQHPVERLYESAVAMNTVASFAYPVASSTHPVASFVPVQARRRKTHVYVVSHTVAAVVHLWSLGVLTAAGCGIGSVHEVVRSNLLVDPSEVEEGEIIARINRNQHVAFSHCVDNQSQDSVASYSGSRRKQQQHPVESLYESAVAMNTVASSTHPVASLVSRRKKRRSSEAWQTDARYPVVIYLRCSSGEFLCVQEQEVLHLKCSSSAQIFNRLSYQRLLSSFEKQGPSSDFNSVKFSRSEEQGLRTLIEVFENRGTKEERTSGEQPRVARDNYLDAGSAAG
ncbi:hypothetical protein F511_34836 [Dorcoceras hygrometricum]|uniref:Uncharacterized protein n=1 Tax=Dorcoceras hygrometricum TaxID=472368 RepID=A0A2Z7BGE9_9LAMI|nr:hypothetical protein F511_34836 [Dorcoceras hygrometricum]